jgi:hypothetical protein
MRISRPASRTRARFQPPSVLLVLLVLCWLPSGARAGEDCIGGEACEEPCPLVHCDTDVDCPSGEVCVVSSTTCCAASSCFCDPVTGEWVCTGDCLIGESICVPADAGECVPALSGVGVAVLAALMAVATAGAALRKRRAN